MEISEREKITLQQAIEMLRKDGLEVTHEEAKMILDFLYSMAEIVVDQYLRNTS